MVKKKTVTISVVAVIVLGLICWAKYSSYEPTSYVVDGENFSAQVLHGGELILDLPSNATTGYSWVIVEEPDAFVSDYNNYVEVNNDDGIVGAGGISQFHIIARNNGTGTMVFQYKQDWDGGNIRGTYELTLDISRHHKIYLQIDNIAFVQAD